MKKKKTNYLKRILNLILFPKEILLNNLINIVNKQILIYYKKFRNTKVFLF